MVCWWRYSVTLNNKLHYVYVHSFYDYSTNSYKKLLQASLVVKYIYKLIIVALHKKCDISNALDVSEDNDQNIRHTRI